MLTHLVLESRNGKTGPIPVSTSSKATCPASCPLYAKGCYAGGGPLAMHWRAVTNGERGDEWPVFVSKIAALPDGQLWRHNQAGDLPGVDAKIDRKALLALAKANAGKRGFTYTHKPMNKANVATVTMVNSLGFTVNLSANTLADADRLADTKAGPVVVVLDAAEGVRHTVTTPAGRTVETCPATYRDDVSCATCQLCQRVDRKVIVGFPAHGVSKKAAAAVARGA